VPFFLGINYLKAMKASLDGDVQLQVLGKHSLTDLTHKSHCYSQFHGILSSHFPPS